MNEEARDYATVGRFLLPVDLKTSEMWGYHGSVPMYQTKLRLRHATARPKLLGGTDS